MPAQFPWQRTPLDSSPTRVRVRVQNFAESESIRAGLEFDSSQSTDSPNAGKSSPEEAESTSL